MFRVRAVRVFAVVVGATLAVAACGDAGSDDGNADESVASAVTIADAGSASDVASTTIVAPAETAPATPASAAGTVAPAPETAPPTVPPTAAPATTIFAPIPRVLLIGDSTLQAVGRYERLGAFTGMDPVYEARSCRLIGIPSCGENPPPNAVSVIDSSEGSFDMVVIMAGYDEWFTTFGASFDQAVASSRAKGIQRIVWLSYPENVDYLLPDGTPGNQSLVNINQIMRDKVASGDFPDVVIADWYSYASAAAPGWWNGDDIHLGPTGATGVADYISRKVAFIASLPCPMPREPDGPIEAPCPDPDVTGPVPDVEALFGI